MKNGLVLASLRIRRFVESALLTVAFYLGIGIMGVLFRVSGVRLMDTGPGASSWNPPSGSTIDTAMY